MNNFIDFPGTNGERIFIDAAKIVGFASRTNDSTIIYTEGGHEFHIQFSDIEQLLNHIETGLKTLDQARKKSNPETYI